MASYDNEDEKSLENLIVEDSEECEKEFESKSRNKTSLPVKKEDSFQRTWREDLEVVILPGSTKFLGENIVKQAMNHIAEAQRVEFVRQWKEIQAQELELQKKRAAFVENGIKILLDAYNESLKQ